MDYLIAGLGNPEERFLLTRHNAGFLAIDALSHAWHIPAEKKFKRSLTGKGSVLDREVLLMKPLTYMNDSGEAILSAVTKFHLEPRQVIILYDDLDLPLGSLRIRDSGSSGGHKGVQSIIEHIGNTFIRIRIGIHAESRADLPGEQYVLTRFPAAELKAVKQCLQKIPDAVRTIISGSVQKAMNDFNGKQDI